MSSSLAAYLEALEFSWSATWRLVVANLLLLLLVANVRLRSMAGPYSGLLASAAFSLLELLVFFPGVLAFLFARAWREGRIPLRRFGYGRLVFAALTADLASLLFLIGTALAISLGGAELKRADTLNLLLMLALSFRLGVVLPVLFRLALRTGSQIATDRFSMQLS